MLAWIMSNIGNIIISAVIAIIVAVVIISMIKRKKKGESSCGCGCSSCPMSQDCHKN